MIIVAILETMWDWRGMTSSAGHTRTAPRYFTINPENHSGRRLYSLIGGQDIHHLSVTNACKELACSAKQHGTPDPAWLRENLDGLMCMVSHGGNGIDLLLVCGKVAQATYARSGFKMPKGRYVLEIPHPAARFVWTAEKIEEIHMKILRIAARVKRDV